MIDNLFLLAIGAVGWGLSLLSYRFFARRNAWPMGALQADLPFIPFLLGFFGFFSGLVFAYGRGIEDGGWVIVVFGLLLALFWIGFLRVGSQISLFITPLVTVLLLIGWLSAPLGYGEKRWATEAPAETLKRRGLIGNE